MSYPVSIPVLWSQNEVSVGSDGFLRIVSEELKDSILEDDGHPPLLMSTSALLRTLYPSLAMKEILAMENCYVMEETAQDSPKSEPEEGLVAENGTASASSSQSVDHNHVSHFDDNLTGTKMNGGPLQTVPSKIEDLGVENPDANNPNQYQQIYQTLVRHQSLSNRIENALMDIQLCRHRRSGSNRHTQRSRTETKVRALEHQQKRLLQKRSTSDAGNSLTTSEGEGDCEGDLTTNTQNDDQIMVDTQSDGNQNGDAVDTTNGADDGNDNDSDDGSNYATNQEPKSVRLVRTLNSIRALFPHLLPITNHKRRNDKKLVIREAAYKDRKRGPMCWLLGTRVYDCTTSKKCIAFHDDSRRILEGYIDKEIAQRISMDPKGSPSFWSSSWVQELLVRSSPSIMNPSTLVSTVTGRSKSEILGWAREYDRYMLALEQQSDRAMKHQYKKSVDKLRNRLSMILSARFKGARVRIYGSCLSDLSLGKGSDVDVSLYIPELQELKNGFQEGTVNAREYEQIMKNKVYQAHRKLMSHRSEFRDLNPITRARIPVITGTYNFADNPYTEDGSIDFDICFLNDIAVANSNLLKEYSLVDPRVRSLMMAVKQWAQDCKINSAKDNHLSSYAWMNLVVFYLQCIRFLPNLQCRLLMEATGLKPDPSNQYWHFVNDLDTCTLLWEDIKKANAWLMPQELTEEPVSLLLYGFFEFYAVRFPYTMYAVSIKRASIILPKLAARKVKHFYSIEDPFETYDSHCPHDLSAPVSESGARDIVDCFRDAEKQLRMILTGKNCSGKRPNWLFKLFGPEARNGSQRNKHVNQQDEAISNGGSGERIPKTAERNGGGEGGRDRGHGSGRDGRRGAGRGGRDGGRGAGRSGRGGGRGAGRSGRGGGHRGRGGRGRSQRERLD